MTREAAAQLKIEVVMGELLADVRALIHNLLA